MADPVPEQAEHEPAELDKAELASRAGVPEFIVDVVVAAGLVVPSGEPGRERFTEDAVDMLAAARTLVDSGISIEELTALAMRHATHTEEVVDDAIELFKRHLDRQDARRVSRGEPAEEGTRAGGVRNADNVADRADTSADSGEAERADSDDREASRAELVELMQRLVPVASSLVGSHFERTLRSRALARLGDEPQDAAGGIVVRARRLGQRLDPVSVYAAAQDRQRMLWVRPDEDFALVALGAVEVIEPHGEARFSAASAARVALSARVRREGPSEAPPPVLTGGFSFVAKAPSAAGSPAAHPVASTADKAPDAIAEGTAASNPNSTPDIGEDPEGAIDPDWDGYPDARWILPEITLVDRSDGTWVLAAHREPAGRDREPAAVDRLEQRIESLAVHGAADPPCEPAGASLHGAARTHGSAPPAQPDQRAQPAQPSEQAQPAQPAREADAGGQAAGHAYTALVADALAEIAGGSLRKVVAARCCEHGPVDIGDVLTRLVARYRSCALIAVGVGDRHFIAASPEQLVALDGGDVCTIALAGTAARSADPQEDERLAAGMLASPKARAEHRFVVDDIAGRLAGLGLVGETPDAPEVLRLARVQHLQTPISARIQRRKGPSDMDVLRVAGVLHPTPAVAGTPTDAALAWIAEHEGFDRGWYAGPVGWCDLDGNGELRVALRSALVDPDGVHLFAGAGIVADSDPAEELAETAVKLRALLDVMEDAAPCTVKEQR